MVLLLRFVNWDRDRECEGERGKERDEPHTPDIQHGRGGTEGGCAWTWTWCATRSASTWVEHLREGGSWIMPFQAIFLSGFPRLA